MSEKKTRYNMDLSLKDAESLFCFLQMASVPLSEETKKYIKVAEKLGLI